MTFHHLLADYGYFAVLAGSLLEGETILILAGFAAHQGHLSLSWVMAVAFVGGTLGDQIFYFAGRRYGDALLRRLPHAMSVNAPRIREKLLRHQAPLIIGLRFMYGLRIAGPIVIGMSNVPARRFLLFNLIGAATWAVLVVGAGYLFGHTVKRILENVEHYEWMAYLAIVFIAVLVALAHRWRRGRQKARA
ncbi:MAG TPA: DedA family protein [Variovorax sp.]|nr:DedA family protein [Variovorax sp.]